ncbi:DUF362 domain-containing protein [bacterium]|nr:DUF362 domain-containing protein [bacterium]
MSSKVYFIPFTNSEPTGKSGTKLKKLFEAAGLANCFHPNDLTAIKLHFGDPGNQNVIAPRFVRTFVEAVKACDAAPFLTDTCVLYKSRRSDAVHHLQVAYEQAYTMEAVDAPIVIADGLTGTSEMRVDIPGKLFDHVYIASEAIMANSMLVLTHFTGHMVAGVGATIKNLGMGLASRKGKLRQHSGIKPQITSQTCTGCAACVKWCPEKAITLVDDVAKIDYERCVGCGQCMAVCRFGAIGHDWGAEPGDLQRKMTEHALGAVINKPGRVGYVTFLTRISRNCDCTSQTQPPLIPDIGVIASMDPVAIDAAAVDLFTRYAPKSIHEMGFPHIDERIQLVHGAEIGLGSLEYELIQVTE